MENPSAIAGTEPRRRRPNDAWRSSEGVAACGQPIARRKPLPVSICLGVPSCAPPRGRRESWKMRGSDGFSPRVDDRPCARSRNTYEAVGRLPRRVTRSHGGTMKAGGSHTSRRHMVPGGTGFATRACACARATSFLWQHGVRNCAYPEPGATLKASDRRC